VFSVIIVEDDISVSKIHAKFLKKIDSFKLVGIANSIDDGRFMIETLNPHLILLDLYFPEGNGLDLLYEIRSQKTNVDVILITAAKDLEHLDKALRGGVFDYMIKPVFFERFQESLNDYKTQQLKKEETTEIDQDFIDGLLRNRRSVGRKLTLSMDDLPKGIDPVTLKKVYMAFDEATREGLSAVDVGKETGLARTTSRKYCEYLLAIGQLQIKLEYGTIGRPERRYTKKQA
jgi:response regulator of citrate/malate metabolism